MIARINQHKYWLLPLLVIVVLMPSLAHAQVLDRLLGISSMASSVVGWVIYTVFYAFALFVGFSIAVVSYFIEIVMQANMHVREVLAVQKGFGISLAIANLGFVLGIIVIAIATILRSQTYGMKQVLATLIVMAVLVNFSMIIVGVILDFSDSMTAYFLDNINPGSDAQKYHNFASALAGSFGPQKGLMNFGEGNESLTIGDRKTYNTASNNSLAAALGLFAQVGFLLIFFLLIVLSLAGLFVMLMIRYVYLGVLLILMPLAWFTRVFPFLKSNWDKWWRSFLRWAFFPPLVIFFLYLAIMTMQSMDAAQTRDMFATQNAGNFGGPDSWIGQFLTQLGTVMGQMILMLGLTIGGLFAANSLGIKFASTAMGMAQGSAKWMGKKAWKSTSHGLARNVQKEGGLGNRVANRLMGSRSGVGRWIGSQIKVAGIAGTEGQVTHAFNEAKKQPLSVNLAKLPTLKKDTPEMMGALQAIKDQDGLKYVSNIEDFISETPKRKNIWKLHGQEDLLGDLQKESGIDTLQHIRNIQAAKNDGERETARLGLQASFRKMGSPVFLPDLFSTKMEKLLGEKGHPMGIKDTNMLDFMRSESLRAAYQTFTPGNFSQLASKAIRGDQWGNITDHSKALNLKQGDIKDDLHDWFDTTGARNLIGDPHISLGIPQKPAAQSTGGGPATQTFRGGTISSGSTTSPPPPPQSNP